MAKTTKTVGETNIVLAAKLKDKLPDGDQWINRIEVKSETSNRVYIVSQNKAKRHFACSCPGWKRHRNCKHLQAIGLPGNEQPYEINQMRSDK